MPIIHDNIICRETEREDIEYRRRKLNKASERKRDMPSDNYGDHIPFLFEYRYYLISN